MNSEEQKILDITVKYEDAIYGIVRYQEKIESLKKAEKSLKEEFEEGRITHEEYVKGMAASKEATKEYKENIRVLSKEVQNNLKVQQEAERAADGQGKSLRALRAELSNLTKDYDNLSKAEREGAKGKELAKHINEITQELKQAEAQTQRYYRNVGNYYGSIMDAMEDLQHVVPMGGGALKNFGGNVVALGQNLEGVIPKLKAFGSAMLSLMANPVFLALAGIAGAGAAFKWFYDYNKGLMEATRLTGEFLGLSGDGLKSVRNEILAICEVYGKDFKETLEGVDTLTAQYGIDVQDALKVMEDGFQAGADLNGDMIQKIKQYAPAFHDAGIAADEMVAIIAQTRSGIFSDKGLDLISMASKKIREMSTATASSLDAIGISSKQVEADLQSGAKSTFDVIQEISAKLRELPQDGQEVGNVLKDVFGKQGASGGLKMIEQLDTMTKSIEEVKKVTGEYGEQQNELLQAEKELEDVRAAVFDVTDRGFENVLMKLKILTTQSLTALFKGLVKVINYAIDIYNNSMLIRGAVEAVGMSFKGLWNVVKMVFNFIIDQVKGVARAFKGLATIIEGALTLNPKKMYDGFGGLKDAVLKTGKEMLTDFKKFGKDTAEAYVDSFNNTFKGKKIEKIGLDVDAGGSGAGSTGFNSGGGVSGGTNGKNGSGGKTGKNNAAEIAKKEQDEIRKAEDLLTKLIGENLEKRRREIQASYDRQIADLRKKLETDKTLTKKAQEAITSQITSLTQLRDRELAQLDDKKVAEDIAREQQYIEMMLSAVKKGSDEEFNLKVQKIENERTLALNAANEALVSEEEKQRNIWAINEKYNHLIEEADKEHQNRMIQQQTEAIQKRYQEQILQAETSGDEMSEVDSLRLQMEQKQEILLNAQQLEGETIQDFNIRKLQMEKDYQSAKKALNDKEVQIEQAKYTAIAGLMGGLSDVAEAFGEESEGLAKAAKFLALGEIAVNTGKAIAAGVAQAQSVPYPANLLAIATTVTTVLANIATAIKTVKSAKFATGGDVIGAGTGTSDSVNARLSNGESVLTAKATQMFAPALSAFNQMGGGVPITGGGQGQQVGEEFLANAVAKGMAQAPRPVVSVEEINRVSNRVSEINQISVME